MSLEADLRAFLLRRVERAAAGVWYGALPQGTDVRRGAIVIQRVAHTERYALDGATGMADATIQVDCWAERAADAIALADDVRLAVMSFAGDGPSEATIGGTHVHVITISGMRDIDEPELPYHRRSIDLLVTYREG